MVDYTISYRASLPIAEPWLGIRWDLFVSAYNASDRVRTVFDKVPAGAKQWVIHPEYRWTAEQAAELPIDALRPTTDDEAECVNEMLAPFEPGLNTMAICVDITGMMRPHLMVLVLILFSKGVRKFDVLYSEPTQYVKQEQTQFSILPVINVRPVLGFEGTHVTSTVNDLLIIGSGYDDALITHASEHKRSARKAQIFGLPSLRPDMYQENVLRARKSAESIGAAGASTLHSHFAPANDPFVTASVLQSIVESENRRMPLTNLYLCPLATKPQALGFALYYLTELIGTAASVIFPFAKAPPPQNLWVGNQ